MDLVEAQLPGMPTSLQAEGVAYRPAAQGSERSTVRLQGLPQQIFVAKSKTALKVCAIEMLCLFTGDRRSD